MKFYIYLITFLITSQIFSQDVRYIDSKDQAVLIDSRVSIEPTPSITLSWENNELATGYAIRKKEVGDAAFPSVFEAEIGAGVTEWTDTEVEIGVTYEYEIRSIFQGTIRNGGADALATMQGFGYKVIGVDPDPYVNRKVLVLVDETVVEPLSEELDRLYMDLQKEGWFVVSKEVPRAEEFDGDKVREVKDIILDEDDNGEIDLIFLLGRVPVPYSGGFGVTGNIPDRHGDHNGAWPADVYYGDLNEGGWTDFQINLTTPRRDANDNVPSDGKFDQSEIPSDIEIGVGRVDFYNMPGFADSEVELLRKYLDKNHAYRSGEMDLVKRALIDDNFAARNYPEGFAGSGWRAASSFLANDSVSKKDWFSTMSTDNYLFAYGTGGGTYVSAGGVGNSTNFSENQVNGVFTMLFGSYFGDWDHENAFMRAALASEPSILTCSWAARPHWYIHHMGQAYPIGYSTRLSQNNRNTYYPNLINTQQGWGIYSFAMRYVHVALMGDPTLTLYRNEASVVEGPTNGEAIQEGYQKIKIDWDPPMDDGIHYWDVFRALPDEGYYVKVNDEPISEDEFYDDYNYDGTVNYLVRERIPVIEDHNNANVYSNALLLQVEMQDLTSIDDYLEVNNVELYPNPAVNDVRLTIALKKETFLKIEISNLTGDIIRSYNYERLIPGEHNIIWDLTRDGREVPSGIYILNILTENGTLAKKLIVQ